MAVLPRPEPRWYRWFGATATAVAVHRIGHVDLADRLAAWALEHDPNGDMPQFARDVLQLAGLPTTPSRRDDDLDALIDEVLSLADRLDGMEQ